MSWTSERIEQLKTLWDEGKSASQIAEAMGDGLTRNAVIGKAHRLGLASRPSPLKTAATEAAGAAVRVIEAVVEGIGEAVDEAVHAAVDAESAAKVPARPAPARPRAPREPAKPAKVTVLELSDRICKWPIGHPDEADFHFCGKPVNPGFPYCGEHCLLAYQAQMPRKDRPAGGYGRPIGPNLPRPR
jgi:GcrA cell cycle regulator